VEDCEFSCGGCFYMGDNMNIASIYPNGLEKTKHHSTGTGLRSNPETKKKALEMLDRGIRINMICEKLSIDKSTIKHWQEAKERY
tara:strand:+ start:388 stop:642 length:255 start_codon:yes stop_codon:yes gene_type:complete